MRIFIADISRVTYIPVKVKHQHDIITDIEDFTDSEGGFVNETMICTLCGAEWTPESFKKEFLE